jgi:hypothetical protein
MEPFPNVPVVPPLALFQLLQTFKKGFERSLTCRAFSKCLTIAAPAKERSDLIVIAEKGNKKLGASVLKDISQIPVAAAFEELAAQFANPQTAVHMGLAKTVRQITKSKQTLYSFVLWKFAQAADDRGIDDKKLTQTSS